MAETARLKEARAITKYLEAERLVDDEAFKDISDVCLPHRGFWPKDGDSKSSLYERGQKNINPAATLALERAAGGMTVGMTPKGQPWFGLGPDDKGLIEKRGIRESLGIREDVIGKMLTRGRFYQSIHLCNLELLGFGNLLLFGDYSPTTLLRTECCTMGTYGVAVDEDGMLETVFRRIRWRGKKLKEKFGLDRLSKTTRETVEQEPFKMLDIVHVVTKRETADKDKIDNLNMPWKSLVYEESSDATDVLSESGYHEMPYFFAPYASVGGSDLGIGPGYLLLGHSKQLNETERQKVIALQKLISPAMRKPAGMKSILNISPGSETEVSRADGEGLKPMYEIPYQAYQAAMQEIQDVTLRVAAVAKADLFYDLPSEMRPKDMTLGEYLERKAERLQQVAPVMAIYEPQVLEKVIERAHNMADRHGLFPPPPPELEGELNVEFTSSVAKAMRQVGAETSRAFANDVFNIADRQVAIGMKPTAAMKMNIPQIVDEFASGVGVPADIVVDDDTFEETLQAVAEQEEQARQEQQEQSDVDSAVKLGNVRTQGTVAGDMKEGQDGRI